MIAQDTGIYKLRTVSAALPSSSTERKDDAEVESAALSAVTCQWSATDLEGEANVLNITTRGSYTAVGSSVCNFGGNVTYRPSGKNVYNVTLTFGGAPCMLPGEGAAGIAVASPLAGAAASFWSLLLTVPSKTGPRLPVLVSGIPTRACSAEMVPIEHFRFLVHIGHCAATTAIEDSQRQPGMTDNMIDENIGSAALRPPFLVTRAAALLLAVTPLVIAAQVSNLGDKGRWLALS